jgi:hypothetical protein
MSLAGSLSDWVTSSFGLVLTIGGGRNVERLVDLGGEIAAAGGPPTPEQQGRLDHVSSSLERHGKTDLALMLLAVAAMATARYL